MDEADKHARKPCLAKPPPVGSGPRPERLRLQTVPFLDDNEMVGPPDLDESALHIPKLRRCPFNPATISWCLRLGCGVDGYVWKVRFGNQGPFALKVFYDTGPPELNSYYGTQRECQNAALLQMMEAAVNHASATDDSDPVLLNPNPRTGVDAVHNVCAFSNQGGHERRKKAGASSLVAIKSTPRLRQCYGWMKLDGQIFYDMPSNLRPRGQAADKYVVRNFARDQSYIAVVYEYIEEAANNTAAVEAATSFM